MQIRNEEEILLDMNMRLRTAYDRKAERKMSNKWRQSLELWHEPVLWLHLFHHHVICYCWTFEIKCEIGQCVFLCKSFLILLSALTKRGKEEFYFCYNCCSVKGCFVLQRTSNFLFAKHLDCSVNLVFQRFNDSTRYSTLCNFVQKEDFFTVYN